MYFLFFILRGWRKRSAVQPQTIYSEFPYLPHPCKARTGVFCRPKPPWPLWGCLGTAEAGGFPRQSLRNFLPIPSSLFPKKPSPFHMGLYFQKVPTVNPSVTAYAVPAPFDKGAFGCGGTPHLWQGSFCARCRYLNQFEKRGRIPFWGLSLAF